MPNTVEVHGRPRPMPLVGNGMVDTHRPMHAEVGGQSARVSVNAGMHAAGCGRVGACRHNNPPMQPSSQRLKTMHATAVVGIIAVNSVLVLMLAAVGAQAQSTTVAAPSCLDASSCATIVAHYGCGSRVVTVTCPATCGGCGTTTSMADTTDSATNTLIPSTTSVTAGTDSASATAIVVTRPAKGGSTTTAPTAVPTPSPVCVDASRCASLVATTGCSSASVAVACPLACGVCSVTAASSITTGEAVDSTTTPQTMTTTGASSLSSSPVVAATTTAAVPPMLTTSSSTAAPDTTTPGVETSATTTATSGCTDASRCPSIVASLGCASSVVSNVCPVSCGTCTRPTTEPTSTATPASNTPATATLVGIRLVGTELQSNSSIYGRIEVQVANVWGTVCNDFFGAPDIQVACRELGYTRGRMCTNAELPSSAAVPNTPIVMDNVRCTGTENALTDCPFMRTHNCNRSQDVCIRCTDAVIRPDTTMQPTTSAPTSAAPTTQQPTTAQPTTEQPTTAAPTTEAPTTLAPTTISPTAATGTPTTVAPTTDAPTTEAPVTSHPTTQSPTSMAPTTSSPSTDAPTTLSPTTAAPTTQQPTTAAPSTEQPTTAAPTTEQPTTAAPTTEQPTTAAPTTEAPTTLAPTTVSPTLASGSPTTVAPTTDAPTTEAPVTSRPTTQSPTSVAPTTSSPSSNAPTTLSPTAVQPTPAQPSTASTITHTTTSPTTATTARVTTFVLPITTRALGGTTLVPTSTDSSVSRPASTLSPPKGGVSTTRAVDGTATRAVASGQSGPSVGVLVGASLICASGVIVLAALGTSRRRKRTAMYATSAAQVHAGRALEGQDVYTNPLYNVRVSSAGAESDGNATQSGASHDCAHRRESVI